MSHNPSLVITRTIQSFGKWSYHKLATKYEKICKNIEDVVSKVVTKSHFVEVEAGSIDQVISRKSLSSSLKPPLQNYKSTIPENALAAQRQLFIDSFCSRNCFKKDFLWRRARQGPLLAFAGLFLCQEEAKAKQECMDAQFCIYDKVCSNIKAFFSETNPDIFRTVTDNLVEDCLNNYKLGYVVDVDASGVTYAATSENEKVHLDDEIVAESFELIPLPSSSTTQSLGGKLGIEQEWAVKAMFPISGMRSVEQILKHSEAELACCGRGQFGNHDGQDGHWPRKKDLPLHPNVLRFEKVFFDTLAPDYDPSWLSTNPSDVPVLFAVSKRYETTLRSYLARRKPDATTASVLILQLLEAAAHLEKHCFVHRNITSKNVMVDFDADGRPRVVLAGFGSCFGGNRKDLFVPFEHERLDTRVGDPSSQAPEICRSAPGRRRFVDYRKSDAWMAGALAYEILTGKHPFEGDACDEVLDSRTYKEEDLPHLDDMEISHVLKVIVQLLLTVDPAKRLTAREAADILHLELFALPPTGDQDEAALISNLRVWLVSHCAEAMIRKTPGSALYDLCVCFFHQVDSIRLSRAFTIWMMLKA